VINDENATLLHLF